MTTYLLYAKSGREFEVAEAIREKGLEAYCAAKMEFVRTGNNRRPEPRVVPYLPNYLFAEIPASEYLGVMAIKYLASTATPLGKSDHKPLQRFLDAAASEYKAAERIKDNQAMISQYKAGQALRCLDGRFSDTMLTFRSMVERAHDMYPKVQAEMQMMGRTVLVEMDPLSVRAAE